MATHTDDHDSAGREAFLARRRKRSIALGLVLAALVLVFYAVTVVKLGPGVLDRQL